MKTSNNGHRSNPAALRGLVALFFCLALAAGSAVAQQKTTVQGKVTDAESGEALPFVQVSFTGTAVGTTTDMEGRFTLADEKSHASLSFRMMGYEPAEVALDVEKPKRSLKVSLVPQAKVLKEVTISSSRSRRRRYSRRNNPAVALAERVIEHRDGNRLAGRERYRRSVYEKLTLALDDFHPDWKKDPLWRHLKFAEKYIDQTPFDATPILTISMRETMMEQTWQRDPARLRTLVTGYRMEGVDQALDQEGFDESLKEMFSHFDIYDEDIELMMNHYVGPLSPSSATTFYHYYITDTVEVDGVRCVELSFAPPSTGVVGLSGHLYIALDSTYRVARYSVTVAPRNHLNFVRDLTVEQSYDRMPDGSHVPGRQDIYCRLYIHRKLQQLYAHRVQVCYSYDFSSEAPALPDSLFAPLSQQAMLPEATRIRRWVWNLRRPIELTFKETMIDSLRFELARLPWARTLKSVSEVIFTDYIPTAKNRDSSRVDIGPVFNTVSYNHEEGWRVRIGGMTKAPLNARHFVEGYAAYGFGDRRWKGGATYTYTFDNKRRHAHESPRNNIQLTASYDMQNPGQAFGNFTRDNFFVSSDVPRKTQYVGTAAVRLQREWGGQLWLDTWLSLRDFEPAGLLRYDRLLANGSTETVARFAEAEWQLGLTYSPSATPVSRRPGNAQAMRRRQDAPMFSLVHRLGYMQGGFPYQSTTFDAEKRVWMGALGFIDAKLKAGAVWNRVPYIRLFFPDASASLWMTNGAFNTMQPMEFVMDRYVALFATYHMRGLILGRLPYVRRLFLREVLGFSLLYGGLSSRNDPAGPAPEGLFVLPDGVGRLGGRPYMEASVGVENILRFIRVDYVWRLTYNEHLAPRERGMVRVGLRLTF